MSAFTGGAKLARFVTFVDATNFGLRVDRHRQRIDEKHTNVKHSHGCGNQGRPVKFLSRDIMQIGVSSCVHCRCICEIPKRKVVDIPQGICGKNANDHDQRLPTLRAEGPLETGTDI